MLWAEPAWFFLLLLLPLPWVVRMRRPGLAWPSLGGFFASRVRSWAWLDLLFPWIEAGIFLGLVLGLARPQTVAGTTRITGEGVAIAIVLDRSSSMEAADFPDLTGQSLTRWESAKRVTSAFVAARSHDLIGLVAFANTPDLTCPLTLDHSFVLDSLRSLRTATSDDDGTNLGDAIVWATDTLRQSNSLRKRMILLSDGRNAPQVSRSHRPVDPVVAAELARSFGIVIDTIAVGDEGGLVREAQPKIQLDIISEVGGPDIALLARISQVSGGGAYRAVDGVELTRAFDRINALEKSSFEETVVTRYDEKFPIPLGLSLGMLAVLLALRLGRGRMIP